MANINDSILIKDASGQMKTIHLGVDGKSMKAQKHPSRPQRAEADESKKAPMLQVQDKPKQKKDEVKKTDVEDFPPKADQPLAEKKELIKEIEKQEKQYTDKTLIAADSSDDKKDELEREIIQDLKGEGIKEVDDIEKQISDKISAQEELPDEPGSEFLQPVPTETVVPSFYFDLEDEQEVARFRDREQILKSQKKQKSVMDMIKEIVQDTGLSVSDGVANRLKKVIDSRLRGVRDLLETKEVLMRPGELGGVGLDNYQAQNVLKIIEYKRVELQDRLDKIEAEKLVKAEQKKKQAMEEKKKEEVMKKIKPVSDYVHPSYGHEVDKVAGKPAPAKIPGKVLKTSQEVVETQEGIRRPAIGSAKKDIKIVGPVEELASFDLESFRKLAASPQQATDKIKNKIDLLQDESFAKRAQGIQSWRSSEVYQNYLLLGRESIEQKQSVSQVVQNKQSKNEPTLSFEEFQAVADLNEELAY